MTSSTHAAKINPFRYRGYYYDEETGLYYLNSRYYDPVVKRFINADNPSVVSSSDQWSLYDKNLFSYCDNNPVNRVDCNGQWWDWISSVLTTVLVAAAVVTVAAVATVATGGAAVVAAATGLAVSTVTTAATGVAAAGTITASVTAGQLIAHVVETNSISKASLSDIATYGKGHQGNMRDTDLRGLSDEEINQRARDKGLSAKEKSE